MMFNSLYHYIAVLVILVGTTSQSSLLSRLNSHTNISTFPDGFFLAFIFVKVPIHPFQQMSQAWTISINIRRISMTLILRQTWPKEITASPSRAKVQNIQCQHPGCPCTWHLFHPLNYRFSDICYPFYLFIF